MGRVRHQNLLSAPVDVDDNNIHYVPGPLISDDGIPVEMLIGGGQAPSMITIGVEMGTETSTPTNVSFWVEFRGDDTDTWKQCQQRANGILSIKSALVPGDTPGNYNLFVIHPEGAQLRVLYQGTGCTGSAYFTIDQITAYFIPKGAS